MTDATDTPGLTRPPRAEPVQPDAPGRSTDRETPPDAEGDTAASKQKQQSDDALGNVREGY